jgi:dihydroorotase
MKGRLVLKNFRIIDEAADIFGTLVVEDGLIHEIIPRIKEDTGFVLYERETGRRCLDANRIIDGGGKVLTPAFVDLHAHFREPGSPEKETLESGCLAAAAGGYGTVVCMANTRPVTDTVEKAAALRRRADALGLISLYPALSLTKGMEGKELVPDTKMMSGATGAFHPAFTVRRAVVTQDAIGTFFGLFSEDGKDVADDALFAAAFEAAKNLNIPVSCHCDFGGKQAEDAKKAGAGRDVWSAIEENAATRRAIGIGRRAGGHIHIAHVSTKEAVALVREAKAAIKTTGEHTILSCEATPHHLALTLDDAAAAGAESYGRVNPPLRREDDRLALIAALLDGTVDAIATDHAPHTDADKAAGAPGFTALETAFSVCWTTLAEGLPAGTAAAGSHGTIGLKQLSFLMSANPARILGLKDRGRIATGLRADLTVIDPAASLTVDPALFKSRGKNSPFAGRKLRGRVLMTLRGGLVVYEAD